MEFRINAPLTLKGNTVELVPLDKAHFAELEALAQDPRIWEFYSVNGSKPGAIVYALEKGLIEKEKGTQYPFTIKDAITGKIMGSTRYIDIQPDHRKLEIGWTWLHPDHWGTAANLECKLLLLTYCFENMNGARVQLKADIYNIRSIKAIQKIGGQQECIFRNDKIRDNGTHRDSVYFSIIARDWVEVKRRLEGLVREKVNH